MSIRPWRDIARRKCRQIMVGKVPVGGDAPIAVQSMTNTLTSDAQATIRQVNEIAEAGADIVRVSCPDVESTAALKEICKNVPVPIVADIHFHYRRAIEAAEAGAACLRINPGNIGSAERVREVVKAARDHGCSMRIGVNAGSLEKDLQKKVPARYEMVGDYPPKMSRRSFAMSWAGLAWSTACTATPTASTIAACSKLSPAGSRCTIRRRSITAWVLAVIALIVNYIKKGDEADPWRLVDCAARTIRMMGRAAPLETLPPSLAMNTSTISSLVQPQLSAPLI